MAYKFEIQNGAVKVTDTISSEVLIFQPSRDTWYIEENLDRNLVKLYGTTNSGGRAENIVVQTLVQLTENDYIEIFVENNTAINDVTVTDLNVIIE